MGILLEGRTIEGDLKAGLISDGITQTNIASKSDIKTYSSGDGIEITNDNVINCTVAGGGVEYSTTVESDTGSKWLDGKTIYQKTFQGITDRGTSEFNQFDISSLGVDTIVNLVGFFNRDDNSFDMCSPEFTGECVSLRANKTHIKTRAHCSLECLKPITATIYYTKKI